jgi:hypothetical protein
VQRSYSVRSSSVRLWLWFRQAAQPCTASAVSIGALCCGFAYLRLIDAKYALLDVQPLYALGFELEERCRCSLFHTFSAQAAKAPCTHAC